MQYKAVIFDLDGTLLDTIIDLTAATNAALAKSGYSARSVEEIRGFVGNGNRKLLERASAGYNDARVDILYSDFIHYYVRHCTENTKPYAGMKELLKKLHDNGIKVAVLTNKVDSASQKLFNYFFPGLLDVALGNVEGMPRKPDPMITDFILSKLGVSPEEAVYVGDSEVDIDTAENAGMDYISVDWGFRSHESLAEHNSKLIVSSVEELEQQLL